MLFCLPTKATSSKLSGGNDLGVLAPAKNESIGNYKQYRINIYI